MLTDEKEVTRLSETSESKDIETQKGSSSGESDLMTPTGDKKDVLISVALCFGVFVIVVICAVVVHFVFKGKNASLVDDTEAVNAGTGIVLDNMEFMCNSEFVMESYSSGVSKYFNVLKLCNSGTNEQEYLVIKFTFDKFLDMLNEEGNLFGTDSFEDAYADFLGELLAITMLEADDISTVKQDFGNSVVVMSDSKDECYYRYDLGIVQSGATSCHAYWCSYPDDSTNFLIWESLSVEDLGYLTFGRKSLQIGSVPTLDDNKVVDKCKKVLDTYIRERV